MRLHIAVADAGKYPDLMALCGEQQFLDGRRDLLLNPSLIAEVLSDSTEGYDRGGKFGLYRGIPSLREYLLVAQDRVSVELYTPTDDGCWLLSVYEDAQHKDVCTKHRLRTIPNVPARCGPSSHGRHTG